MSRGFWSTSSKTCSSLYIAAAYKLPVTAEGVMAWCHFTFPPKCLCLACRLAELPNTSHFCRPVSDQSADLPDSHLCAKEQHNQSLNTAAFWNSALKLSKTGLGSLAISNRLLTSHLKKTSWTVTWTTFLWHGQLIKALDYHRVSKRFCLQAESRKLMDPASGQVEVTRQNLVPHAMRRDFLQTSAMHSKVFNLS